MVRALTEKTNIFIFLAHDIFSLLKPDLSNATWGISNVTKSLIWVQMILYIRRYTDTNGPLNEVRVESRLKFKTEKCLSSDLGQMNQCSTLKKKYHEILLSEGKRFGYRDGDWPT